MAALNGRAHCGAASPRARIAATPSATPSAMPVATSEVEPSKGVAEACAARSNPSVSAAPPCPPPAGVACAASGCADLLGCSALSTLMTGTAAGGCLEGGEGDADGGGG
eukprot:132596-Pleurochrysis_carterae.AAC.2